MLGGFSMKFSKMKKAIALASVLTMVLPLAACGGKDGGNSSQGSDSQSQSQESNSGSTGGNESSSQQSEAQEKPEASYPDDVTLTYYLRGGTAEYEPYLYKDLVGMQKIQEATGITLDYEVVCGDSDAIKTQYLAMIQSGKYPDVIQWLHKESYNGGVDQLYNDGVIIELNDLIENHMPNLKKILDEHPNLAKDMMNDNGQYLYFTKLNPLESQDDLVGICNFGFLMRKDWLENVGLNAPTTIDEWYEVLKAFKTQDPNGNGIDDEIPFDAGAAGLNLFYPAFDILNGIYVDPATGKVGYGPYSENYREFLTTMNKWYSEGLIGNIWAEEGSFAIADGGSTDEHIYGDIAGSWKGLANNWEQRLPGILEKNPNADLVACIWPYSTMSSGVQYTPNTYYSTIDRTTTCISVDCKYPEAAAKLIDYMYSEEGGMYLTWGVEGETYSTDANGKHEWTDYGNEVIEYYDGSFPRKFTYAMAHVSFPRFGQNDVSNTYGDEYANACDIWSKCDVSLIYPGAIAITQDELDAAIGAESDMGDYISEMQMKFITGEEPLTNYDTYLEELKKKGVEDYIKVYQDAYDRYNAR